MRLWRNFAEVDWPALQGGKDVAKGRAGEKMAKKHSD
jgi:hypothetical protein